MFIMLHDKMESGALVRYLEASNIVDMMISGMICTIEKKDACVIKVPHECGQVRDIAIKSNALMPSLMEMEVNLIDVHGGRTLKMLTGDKDALLISLEWLEPASPSISPDESVLTFCCPCCHAFKLILVAYEVPLLTRKEDCPIGMEMKEYHILKCEHGVCHLCWRSCQQMAISYGSIQCEDLDLEELQKNHAVR